MRRVSPALGCSVHLPTAKQGCARLALRPLLALGDSPLGESNPVWPVGWRCPGPLDERGVARGDAGDFGDGSGRAGSLGGAIGEIDGVQTPGRGHG
jgi:hypothetical protein